MKRFLTLLWLTLTAFSFTASAQTNPCNAEFSVQYQTNATVKFNPVITLGSPTYEHIWVFGDGSPASNLVSPIHTYALPGTYTSVHTIIRFNANHIPECTQSFTKIVTIIPECNLVVNFSSAPDPSHPLRIKFYNLSVPVHPTDSVKWTFGDGTGISGLQSDPNVANPTHNYANAGSYNVCLVVKKNNASTPNACIKYICRTVLVQAPCNLVADFNWTVTQTNPLRIEFHNLSTPLSTTDSIRWTFGDGSSSTAVNPVHIYNVPGTYTVCLRVKKLTPPGSPPCVREICKTIIIPVPCNLVVDFSSAPDPNHPLRIKFYNLSVPVHASDSVKWTFGDGTGVSGLQSDPNVANPTHNYANAGSYTVCLVVKKNNNTTSASCVRYKCKPVVVHQPCNLEVDFSSAPDPNHPLRIKFYNLSVPVHASDSVKWTFGDGTGVSGLQSDPNVANPTHNYATGGNYTVCLRVKKNNIAAPNICVREICKTIEVRYPCNFPIGFDWRIDSLNHKKVYFINRSVPPTAAATATWTFGDGTSATTWNAVHEYAQPGRYRVCLKISIGQYCVREFCDTIFIPHPLPPCTQLSKFRFEKFSNDNQKYKFIPDYLNNALQYTWTFGDGTGSHDPIAIHRYAQPGVYVACLTVWRGPNCASTTCKEIVVRPQINCDTAHVSFTYQREPQIPNKIHFYASGSLPILDQTWTITKLPASTNNPPVILHQNNPVYLFQDTGYYRVCLRAVLLGGCVKEFCTVIRIEHVSNACLLQAYPNPASTMVNVNVYLSQPEMIHAYVYNSLNVLVKQKQQQGYTGNNVVNINVNDLPHGLYNIKLVYGNKICYARFEKL